MTEHDVCRHFRDCSGCGFLCRLTALWLYHCFTWGGCVSECCCCICCLQFLCGSAVVVFFWFVYSDYLSISVSCPRLFLLLSSSFPALVLLFSSSVPPLFLIVAFWMSSLSSRRNYLNIVSFCSICIGGGPHVLLLLSSQVTVTLTCVRNCSHNLHP